MLLKEISEIKERNVKISSKNILTTAEKPKKPTNESKNIIKEGIFSDVWDKMKEKTKSILDKIKSLFKKSDDNFKQIESKMKELNIDVNYKRDLETIENSLRTS